MAQVELHPIIADEVPWSDHVTAYDEAHFIVYVRLLDAEAAGARRRRDGQDRARDRPGLEPERAARALASHLGRARWMTEIGYRDLLQ